MLPKKQLVSILVLVILVLSVAIFAEAGVGNRDLELNYPSIPGPNGPLTLGPKVEDTTLPQLIEYLYTFSISIAGLIAFGSFVVAGFLFMTSGANPGLRNQAKKRIQQALLGLALLFGAYIILNIINPELVLLHEPGVRQELTTPTTLPDVPPTFSSRITLSFLGGTEFKYKIDPEASGSVDCDLKAADLTGKYKGEPGDERTLNAVFLEPLLALGGPQRYTLICFDEDTTTVIGIASTRVP